MPKARLELIRARESAGLTQAELAEAVGISRTFYVHIEKGRRIPSLPVAIQIAERLQRPVEEIFCDLNVSIRHNAKHATAAESA